MDPIVHGLKRKYASCMTLERVNFHEWTSWHDLLFPLASPEFALLDSDKQIIYRWFGFTEEEEFSALLDPLCGGSKKPLTLPSPSGRGESRPEKNYH